MFVVQYVKIDENAGRKEKRGKREDRCRILGEAGVRW
jgi:hypothetical protein